MNRFIGAPQPPKDCSATREEVRRAGSDKHEHEGVARQDILGSRHDPFVGASCPKILRSGEARYCPEGAIVFLLGGFTWGVGGCVRPQLEH